MKAIAHSVIMLLVGAATLLAGPTTPEMPPAGDNIFTSAGFRAVKPWTPEQRLLYGVAPSYRVLRAGSPRHNFFVYKDEANWVAYVGDEVDYARLLRLAGRESGPLGFFYPKDMELDPAWRWAEAFGPVRHVWGSGGSYAAADYSAK